MDITNTLQTLTYWLIAIGAVIIVLLVVVFFVVPKLTRRRALRQGTIPDAEARSVREQLLEAVRQAATEPKTHVDLSGFWKGTGYTSAQRFFILDPLIKGGILTPAWSSDGLINSVQTVGHILAKAPRSVILNTRDWTRMATGVSAGVLINGDNLGVVQSGGQSNTAAVVTAGSTEDLARVVGNIDWLVGELRKIGTTEQDIGDLETKLQVTPVAQQRQVVEAWQHGLVKRVSDLLGQGMAGIMANLLSPILARFLGLG